MHKLSLRLFGLLGIILFAPLFTFTFLDLQLIEKSASGFVKWKLQSEVNEKIFVIFTLFVKTSLLIQSRF